MDWHLKFDPRALYEAIDAQRRTRGMTWADLSRELRISTSTLRGITKARVGLEMDGVLGMCLWLDRTLESFAGGKGNPSGSRTSMDGPLRRFDKKLLYAAVDAERERRRMTWDQVAKEVWPAGPWGADQLQRMKEGGRAEVFSTLPICLWLGKPAHTFMRDAPI